MMGVTLKGEETYCNYGVGLKFSWIVIGEREKSGGKEREGGKKLGLN